MSILIREYSSADEQEVADIWNQVVSDGDAFPQEKPLSAEEADSFFHSQSYTGVAVETGQDEIVGMYILHPNNVGRCGHICNASYAVKKNVRGEHIGEKLVRDCMKTAHEKGFQILQFNAVVVNNIHAIHLYERLGFEKIGMVPGGFRMPDGSYEDILLFYHPV